MNKIVELENLDRVIRNGDIRLHTIKMNMDSLTKEIDMLQAMEEQLIQNIKCLKSNKIIAIATEYKKAKEELKKTTNRLISLKNDRENYKKAVDATTFDMNKAREDIEKLKRTGDSNVLYGKFGRKPDGQG